MKTVRVDNDRVQTRLCRNHFSNASVASDWSLSVFNQLRGGNIIQATKPAEKASERSRRYRFGKVNAVRSITQLQGDDLSVLEDTEENA